LQAEELESFLSIDSQLTWGVRVRGDFQYDRSISNKDADDLKDDDHEKSNPKQKEVIELGEKGRRVSDEASSDPPFALRGIDLHIPRGLFFLVTSSITS
jgi:hypothetical protein